MSIQLTHQQIEDLLGAFAMDAVDGDEAEAIELHLRDCPRCRAEVTEHREVAALLAHTGSPAPEGVWNRILDELEPVPPALRMPGFPPAVGSQPTDEAEAVEANDVRRSADPENEHLEGDATVTSLWSRRSTMRVRTLVAVLSAAAVIVAVLGVVTFNQSRRLDRMDTSLREVSVDRIATQAMSDPQATTAKLVSKDSRVTAPVVLNSKGKGYLLAAKLPELPKDRTYQLWAHVNGAVLSLGVFDGGTDVVQFQLGNEQRAALKQLMVTEETAPGVVATNHRPILSTAV
ncbi:MAG: anti-sigma factor [Actinomycetota bacterium]|nr:anti-sigma factor [Actinomycetota bacterium]